MRIVALTVTLLINKTKTERKNKMKTLKKLFIVLILLFAVNSYSQTYLSVGTAEFYSFPKHTGEASVFKQVILSEVHQTFGKFLVSAITAAVVDSIATPYVGTRLAYLISQSKDFTQNIYVSANILKGEKRNAITGIGATLQQGNTLIGVAFEHDLTNGDNWGGLTLGQILLK